jgi:hypothetical protein
MADDSWGAQDQALPVWSRATYYRYPSVAILDRLRKKMRGVAPVQATVASDAPENEKERKSASIKIQIRRLAKTLFYKCFPVDPIYPLEKTCLGNA